VGAALIHADRRTEITKLIGALHDYADAPKNIKSAQQWSPEATILAMDAVTALPPSSLDLRQPTFSLRRSCRTKSSGMCRLRCLVKSYRCIEGSSCLYLQGQSVQDTATGCLHLHRRTIPKKEAAGQCETLANLLPDYITSRSSYDNLKFLTSTFVFLSSVCPVN